MKKIGQSMHPNWVNGDLERLEEELQQFQDAGAQSCELVLNGLDVIIGARIIPVRLDAVIKLMRKFDMDYTLHMPHGLNLMDADNLEVNMKIFRETIEFVRAAGINVINYHAGMKRIDDKLRPDKGVGSSDSSENSEKPVLDSDTLIRNEIEQIKSLVKEAPDITFCMENALFSTEPVISAMNSVASTIEFHKQVGFPNFKLTFDIGHNFLFNKGDKDTMLSDLRQLLPYTGHIHLHDNCGIRADARDPFGFQRLIMGTGDIHLPLGWGSLPIEEALGLLDDYDGIVNLEIEQRFKSYYKDCIDTVRGYL